MTMNLFFALEYAIGKLRHPEALDDPCDTGVSSQLRLPVHSHTAWPQASTGKIFQPHGLSRLRISKTRHKQNRKDPI